MCDYKLHDCKIHIPILSVLFVTYAQKLAPEKGIISTCSEII